MGRGSLHRNVNLNSQGMGSNYKAIYALKEFASLRPLNASFCLGREGLIGPGEFNHLIFSVVSICMILK